jgi:pimeloyl-ACP methyl ester carboxylesterase
VRLPERSDAHTRRATRWTVRGTPTRDGQPVELAAGAVGPAGAPAVVLGHGVGSSARFVLAACAAPVVTAGFQLVTFDQRGHGRSSPAPDTGDHHLDAYAADLAAIVRTLDAPVAAVGGVSLGGHAAVRAPLAAPRIVCLPAWTGRAPVGSGPHAAVADEIRQVGVAGVLARLRADTAMPRWLRETLVTDYAGHDPASLTAALVALDGGHAPTAAEVAALAGDLAVVAWPDDPGHPLAVARSWSEIADGAPVTTLRLDDLEDDLTRFGDAVVTALATLT